MYLSKIFENFQESYLVTQKLVCDLQVVRIHPFYITKREKRGTVVSGDWCGREAKKWGNDMKWGLA